MELRFINVAINSGEVLLCSRMGIGAAPKAVSLLAISVAVLERQGAAELLAIKSER